MKHKELHRHPSSLIKKGHSTTYRGGVKPSQAHVPFSYLQTRLDPLL